MTVDDIADRHRDELAPDCIQAPAAIILVWVRCLPQPWIAVK